MLEISDLNVISWPWLEETMG